MTFSSRLWRVLRGVSNDFEGVDPDELLKKLRAARQRAQAAAGQQSGAGSRPRASQTKTGGVPTDVAQAYTRLEIPTTSTVDEAKKAWRKLMRKYHPDRHQGDERKREVATKVAASLTESYELIKEYREKYGHG
ncbi:MAG: J domain-containing protein [Planctomycetota bacterium]|nr:J domain-containing protein [Planctomycetota bacterium]